MTTPILKIPEVANNQTNQYITVNEAIRILESASNEFAAVDFTAGDVTLTESAFTSAFMFYANGLTADRLLTVPQSKRMFGVKNNSAYVVTIKRGTTQIPVSPGVAFIFYADGTENGLFGIAGGARDEYANTSPASGALNLATHKAVYVITLGENVTSITLPSAGAGEVLSMLLIFKQDATGGRTVTGWPTAFFEGGSAPVINGAANAITSVPVLVLGNGDIYIVG